MQDEDKPKRSFKDRIKPYLQPAAACAITGVTGAVAVIYYYKMRTTITWCAITMENIDQLKEQGQGVIGFGMDSRDKILFALPDID